MLAPHEAIKNYTNLKYHLAIPHCSDSTSPSTFLKTSILSVTSSCIGEGYLKLISKDKLPFSVLIG